ncbi:hypothetical protein BGX24_001066 [Mortierella sp. AD032]|nr:hypothetical protein BGX24_001066 [Mortierella sp. AD032]
MGDIKLLCLTADPGLTTLYGFAYGYSSRKALMKQDMDTMILIKSQANPSNIADIKWSAVSILTDIKSFADIPTRDRPNHACAVSSAGVFTAFNHVMGSPSRKKLMHGVRFDPAGRMAPEYNLTGGGAWSTIDLAPSYNMTEYTLFSRNDVHKLFYDQKGGKETLFHAYPTYSKGAPAIRIGVVNETGGHPTLEPFALYKNETFGISTIIADLAYGNNQLFAYEQGANPVVVAISLSNGTSTSKPSIKRFSSSTSSDCKYTENDLHSGLWKNFYFLYCSLEGPQAGSRYGYQVEIINSTLTDNTTSTMTRGMEVLDKVAPISYFQAIGGHLPGQEAFVAISYWAEIQGITLTGPSAGTSQNVTDVYINGVYVDGSRDQNEDFTPLEPREGLSPTVKGIIAAGLVMIFPVVSLIAFRSYRRYRRNRAAVIGSKTEINEEHSVELYGRPSSEIELKGRKTEISVETEVAVSPLTGLTSHPRPAVITSLGSATL